MKHINFLRLLSHIIGFTANARKNGGERPKNISLDVWKMYKALNLIAKTNQNADFLDEIRDLQKHRLE